MIDRSIVMLEGREDTMLITVQKLLSRDSSKYFFYIISLFARSASLLVPSTYHRYPIKIINDFHKSKEVEVVTFRIKKGVEVVLSVSSNVTNDSFFVNKNVKATHVIQ